MKVTAFATFALFALASAELRKLPTTGRPSSLDRILIPFTEKIPRSQKGGALDRHIRRQTDGPKTQVAAMSTADGGVVTFDTANVHKQMTADGL